MSGNDLRVVVGRRIEVVVVEIEPGILQVFRLTWLEHAEGQAGFQSERLDRFDHFDHQLEVLVPGVAPGGTHAEAGGTASQRFPGGGEHLGQRL
jgi:hypothetical protein